MTVFISEAGKSFITETGTSPRLEARASVINGKITLESSFAKDAYCLVGIKTCHLATGRDAGPVALKKQNFVAPNTIEVTVELDGVGNIPGRDLYWAELNYVVVGQSA